MRPENGPARVADMTRSRLTAPIAERLALHLEARGSMRAPRSSADLEAFSAELAFAMRRAGKPVGHLTALHVSAVIFGFRGWPHAVASLPGDVCVWAAGTPLRSMIGHGATLVSGTRGCGKTRVLARLGRAAMSEGRKVFVVSGGDGSPLLDIGAVAVSDVASAVTMTRRGALLLVDDRGPDPVRENDIRAIRARSAWVAISSESVIANRWADHLLMRSAAPTGWLPEGVGRGVISALPDGHGVLSQAGRPQRRVRVVS